MRLGVLFATILASLLVNLPIPWIEKVIVDEVLPGREGRRLAVLVAVVAGLLAGQQLLVFGRRAISARLRQRVLTDVRMRLYEHLQRLSLRFHGRNPAGNLLSRITNDVGYVQSLLNDELFEVAASVLRAVVVVGLLLSISVRLTVGCAVVVPVVLGVFLVFRRLVYRRSRELQQAQERLSGHVMQNLACIKLIQAEAIEEAARAQTLATSRELERVGVRRDLVGVTGNLLASGLTYVPLIVVVWGFGGMEVIGERLTLGGLLAFTQYMLGLVGPATGLFRFVMNLQGGWAALDRIHAVLDERPEVVDAPGARPVELPVERVELRGVSLHFDGGTDALVDGGDGEPGPREVVALAGVDLELRRGEKVALVGPSGGGKSSVLHLLLRLYDPSGGEVLVNGRPVGEYTVASLRRAFAYVPQELFLFGRSVRHNLTLGRAVGEERLQEALRVAAADGVVAELDGGLGARLEPGGTNLSGGQRQRLSLARALARDASVYLFDEATAALDPGTEQRVLDGLKTHLQGRTLLMVAHRPALLALADRIVVMAEGRVVEQGSQAELLARGGLFATLYGPAAQASPRAAADRGPNERG